LISDVMPATAAVNSEVEEVRSFNRWSSFSPSNQYMAILKDSVSSSGITLVMKLVEAAFNSSRLLASTLLLRSSTKRVLLWNTWVLEEIRAWDSEGEIKLKHSSFLPCS